MTRITNKRLEKVNYMSELYKRYEETKLTIRDFCEKEGMHTSKFCRWKKRYNQQGKKGMLDKRQGIPYKVKDKVKLQIHKIKEKYPLKSASDISKIIEKKFKIEVCERHIQRILKEIGLNDPVGRKAGKPIKKTSD